MDPHHFEPSLKEIKSLIDAKTLALAPAGINPWAIKIAQKRIGKDLKTLQLKVPQKFFTKYQTKNTEALAHYWVYPDILCYLKNEMQGKGLSINEFDCSEEKVLSQTQKLTKLIGGKRIVITHDALAPLFTHSKALVLTLVSSEHGHRPDLSTYKELADWQKDKEKIIWLLEKNIKTNKNILKKIKPSDIQIKIDITGKINQDPFFIWDELIKELESNVYANPNS